MPLPDRIFAQASPTSRGGNSLFNTSSKVCVSTVSRFASLPAITGRATDGLARAGFEILQVTPFTINIAGDPDDFERAFRTKIVEKEVARPNGTTSTHLDSPDTGTLGLIATAGTAFGDSLEGVALEVPRAFLSPVATPPTVDYWHLDVPADVALASNASAIHRHGVTGRGIRVAMVDSGWYRHPFFDSHGFTAEPVILGPGATEPDADESGHGTGESANIFSVAPDCTLLPVKANFVNTVGAFNAAVALAPDVISCSWGSHSPSALSAVDMALSASISAAVRSGIVVVFSAGNGHAGFPGQHPQVISAGGVYLRRNGGLEASNYSSGFQSLIFPGRRVPDVCGLVGMRPKAIYIMLPVQPADAIDAENAAGGNFPAGDQTAPDDGWAAFSGTSAAAPQLAGAAALIRQAAPELSPEQVKTALTATAKDVVEGMCSPVGQLHAGLPAEPGPDDATGFGLLDATAAVMAALDPGAREPGPTLQALVSAYYQGIADAARIAALEQPLAIGAYGWAIAQHASMLAALSLALAT